MALKARKAILLAKVESTYGTDSVPTGAANAILTSNLSISPIEGGTEQRNLDLPYFGGELAIHVGVHVKCEFDVELASSGTAGTAPAWGPLVISCGTAETVTALTKVEYKPISTDPAGLSMYLHFDGQKHAIVGARGTFTLNFETKKIPHLHFTFTGLWVDPAATSDPTPTLTGFKAPLPVSDTNTPTFSIHSTTPNLTSLQFDCGNTVVHRDVVGSESVIISDRVSKGKCTIEAPALGTKNWFTAAKANSTGTIQLIHGTAAGYIVQLDGPVVQAMNPKYGNQDGVRMLDLDLSFTPSAGNDEFVLTAK